MNDFIKMCDCPEVQWGWQPVVGDIWLHKEINPEKQRWLTAIEAKSLRLNRNDIPGFGARYHLWLPRLDQIIAMLPEGWGWGPIREFLLHWDVGVRRDFKIYSYTGPTFEHAALQAVMYARHSQRWDAERKVWE